MKLNSSVVLEANRDKSIKRNHPWIFSGAIQSINGNPEDGNWVEVLNSRKQTLGYGHFQKGSITVRVLSFGPEAPSESFWVDRLTKALQHRAAAGLPNEATNAFRLIHGEGDSLPGLIVDYYDGVAVMQAHSVGMHADRKNIASALVTAMPSIRAVYYKSKATLPGDRDSEEMQGFLFGDSASPHSILEHNNKFLIDFDEGQKTGFFLDQRENRRMLGDYVKDKSVLNTFCYTGGFSVYALKAGARLVHSVDASEKAVELTRKNIELNGFDAGVHACYVEDTFEFLKGKKDVYDVIVLDPPAFAKHRNARHQAVKGYQRLNTEAMRAIRSGGIIFTFSCSQVVDRQLFYDTIVSAGIQSDRKIKVLSHLCQPADHPVSMYHPEGEYLKGLVLLVE